VYCGQTIGWIKMPLGTKVGLSSGDIVLDGIMGTQLLPPPPKKGGIWPMSVVAKVLDGSRCHLVQR